MPALTGLVFIALVGFVDPLRAGAKDAVRTAPGKAGIHIARAVLLSVVAHGVTAGPLAARYARLLAHRAGRGPDALMPDMPDRRLIRRSSPPQG
jgi:hypothetical protein